MVSEPDYDPNNPREANDPTRINRLTTGVYEMGSTFKALTLAMALDSGKATLALDLRRARIRCTTASFTIHDYHAEHRVLTVPEIFTYSSNIGTARMALAVGVEDTQGVPEQDGPARPAAHRTAGKRRADRAEALGRAQHRHHRLRPRPLGRAAAGGDGRRRHASTAACSFRRPSSSAARATRKVSPSR